jgi:hypothetical protein
VARSSESASTSATLSATGCCNRPPSCVPADWWSSHRRQPSRPRTAPDPGHKIRRACHSATRAGDVWSSTSWWWCFVVGCRVRLCDRTFRRVCSLLRSLRLLAFATTVSARRSRFGLRGRVRRLLLRKRLRGSVVVRWLALLSRYRLRHRPRRDAARRFLLRRWMRRIVWSRRRTFLRWRGREPVALQGDLATRSTRSDRHPLGSHIN